MGDLPYLIHTNRELGLMLRGQKPLAMFAEEYDHTPDGLHRYLRMFDRHVAASRFVKRTHHVDAGRYQFRYIFYALPTEAWRIDRMIRLKEMPGLWTEEHEREEGELLGYEDWMNTFWVERQFNAKQGDA
jgi:hypothetical protein